MMVKFCIDILLLIVLVGRFHTTDSHSTEINQLVTSWAPLIWLSPDEDYFPLSSNEFLMNVHLETNDGRPIDVMNEVKNQNMSETVLHLVTNENIDVLKSNISSFLHGKNPGEDTVPIYAVINMCKDSDQVHLNEMDNDDQSIESELHFTVTYWIFYPYNKGKQICFLGQMPVLKIFGYCLGTMKTLGNHVGDWERMSLIFRGQPFPTDMFLAVHNGGAYYRFDAVQQLFKLHNAKSRLRNFKYPKEVQLAATHPIVFAAAGSHGLWATPGVHEYLKTPNVYDDCGLGVPWNTWKSIEIYSDDLPRWARFRGRWGNQKERCVLFKKLGFCEQNDGPHGILRTKQDFVC